MEIVERVLGHEATLEGLWRAAREGRLPHALLFEGPSGIGKLTAARRLANGLLCAEGPGPPCGACGPCKRVRSGGWRGNHPDLYTVDAMQEAREDEAAGKKVTNVTIKLRRIAVRDGDDDCAEGFLRLVSAEGGWRIVLLREAHRMQREAQNALLKTLEEPGTATLLVLETSRPSDLLPTVRSRCVRVRFDPLDGNDAAAVLAAEGVDPARGEALARWAGGSPGEALRLEREHAGEVRELVAAVIEGSRSPLEASTAVWDVEGDFRGSTPPAKARQRARSALDLALGIAADLLRHLEGAPAARLAHGDLAERLADGVDLVRARHMVERCLELRGAMDANVTGETAVDRCFLVLARGAGLLSPTRI